MSSDKSDPVQKLNEQFQELSEEQAREFVKTMQFDPDLEDIMWPWPPGDEWPTPPWNPVPPGDEWPTPPWGPSPWPPWDEPPVKTHSARRRGFQPMGLQSAGRPTASVRVSTSPELRREAGEDTEETPFEVNVTIDAANTVNPQRLGAENAVKWVKAGTEILGQLLGQAPEGGGTVVLKPGGGIFIFKGDVTIINGGIGQEVK